MSYVVGIDQSVLHTGVCVLDVGADRAQLTLIEPPSHLAGVERLVYLQQHMRAALSGVGFAEVSVLEGYSIGSINRPFDLGEVGGITKVTLHAHSHAVYSAAPKQLKRFVTGKGTASKDDVKDGIAAQWKQRIADDNLADAYGLAKIAHCILDPRVAKRRAQTEIAEAVKATVLPKVKAKKGISRKRLSM